MRPSAASSLVHVKPEYGRLTLIKKLLTLILNYPLAHTCIRAPSQLFWCFDVLQKAQTTRRNFNCSMHCIVDCKPEHQIALSKSGSMHWNRWLLTTKKNRICLSDHSLQTPATFGGVHICNSEYSTWMSWTDRMFRFRWPRGGEWVTPMWNKLISEASCSCPFEVVSQSDSIFYYTKKQTTRIKLIIITSQTNQLFLLCSYAKSLPISYFINIILIIFKNGLIHIDISIFKIHLSMFFININIFKMLISLFWQYQYQYSQKKCLHEINI